MRSHSVSPFLSLGFAVMLLLSIAVHPVMAADATKHQLDSFSVEDIQSVTVDELVSDQTVSGFMVSASSSDDIQETRIGKVHIRAKDPMADQHRPDLGEFSASSAVTSDMVDAEIARAVADLNREGYVPTGQTEHRYESQFDSEKFRHIDRAHQALLEAQGLHMDALNPAVLTSREDVTYYFLTNTGTNATRVISVVQMIGPEGEPVGDRVMKVSPDLVDQEGDAASGDEFSASMVTETTALLGPLAATGWIPGWCAIVIGVLVILTIVLVVVVVVECVNSDTPTSPPSIEWQRPFGGSDYDFGEFITRTSNNDVLILGATRSSDGDMQGLNLHGFQDMVVARLSGDTGTPINKNLIGGPEADSDGKLILETPDAYLLIGNTKALTGDFVNSQHHGDSEHLNSDVSLVKVDKNNLLIIGTPFLYGGSDEDVVNWGILSNDGNSVILTGYTYSNDGDFTGLNKGDADIFALKIDIATGAVLAKNTYGGSGYDEGGSIVKSPDGSGYFIGGDTTSNDIAGLEGKNHGGNGGTKDAFIFYIDENLNRDNSRSWLTGGSLDDEIWSMDTTSDNQLVFTGSTNSNDGQIPSSKHGLAGVDDAWLVKLNVQDGSILLNRCYGGQYPDYGMSVREYQNGYLLLAHTSSPPGDGDVISKYGGDDHTMDVWLLRLDQDGTINYQKNLGGTSDDYTKRFGVQNSPDLMDSGYILGNTWSTDNDVSGNHGKMDMWIVKLKAARGLGE